MGLQTAGSGADAEKPSPAYLAMRLLLWRQLRCLVACSSRILDCFDACVKWLGPLFVILALGLFAFEAFTFFRYVLPGKRARGASLEWTLFLASTGVFLLFSLLYNYALAVLTSPGSPPLVSEAGRVVDAELGESATAQCAKCLRLKPPRTHHCSVCQRCILKMDHHCPWINNCVGFRNYRYFCLFLWYLAGCCAFVSMVFAEDFFMGLFHPRRSRFRGFAKHCVGLSWVIATTILLAVLVLGGFHLYLVLSNQTTIEYLSNSSNKAKARRHGEYFRNPYDLGRRRNFQQVFGPDAICGFRWMLPYLARGPSGDGMRFPSLAHLRA